MTPSGAPEDGDAILRQTFGAKRWMWLYAMEGWPAMSERSERLGLQSIAGTIEGIGRPEK